LQIPYASVIRVSVSDEGGVAVMLQFDESMEGGRALGVTRNSEPLTIIQILPLSMVLVRTRFAARVRYAIT
jgi:hypothetical protein